MSETNAHHSPEDRDLPVELTADLLANMNPDHIVDNHETYLYQEEPPKFQDQLHDDLPRDNSLRLDVPDGFLTEFYDKRLPETTTFSERQAMQNLAEFLTQAEQLAQELEGTDEDAARIRKLAREFQEELVYIGEPELHKAIDGTAAYWLEMIRSGTDVYVIMSDDTRQRYRSDFYCTLLALESFDTLAQEDREAGQRLRIGEVGNIVDELARKDQAGELADDYRVVFFDDFSVSGQQLHVQVARANSPYKQAYLRGHFEADYIATHGDEITASLEIAYKKDPTHAEDFETSTEVIRKVSYYRAESDNRLPIVTGSHSSTDNSFESQLRDIQMFLRRHDQAYTKPLPVCLRRPYEWERVWGDDDMQTAEQQFDDPTLMSRWEAMLAKYKLHK